MPPALRHALVVGAMVLIVVGLLAVLSAAYRAGYTTATAEGEAALEKLRTEHAQADTRRALQAAADAKAAANALREQTQRADQAAAQLAAQQRQNRQTTDRLTGEIARVNDLYQAALDAPPEPLPACMFTRGFVRVWNEAIGAAVPAAEHPGGAAATPPMPEPLTASTPASTAPTCCATTSATPSSAKASRPSSTPLSTSSRRTADGL